MDKFLNRSVTKADAATCSKKKSDRNFRSDWLLLYPWLKENQNGKKLCILCDTTIIGSQYHLQRHADTDVHKKLEIKARSTPRLDNFITKVTASDSISNKARNLEIMLTNFAAEHNLAFAVLDHLNAVLKNGITDSVIVKNFNINRRKGTKYIVGCSGPANTKQVVNFCKQQYFSIIVDESTDCTVSKNLAILVRLYVGKSVDRFLTLVQVPDGSAQSIFSAIMEVLQNNEIPINNLVGFGADNCSVMMGKSNGVQSLLKEVQPNLYVNGCFCHILNLASQNAAQCLPKTIDVLIRGINHYFCNSSSRKEDFSNFQKYFNSEEHVILKYAPTRWLSRQTAVDRIIEQWDPLTYYFTVSNFESKETEKTAFILENLDDDTTKLYFLFLSYILKIINDINIEMQSEDTRVHVLMKRISFLFKQVARNFLNKKYIDSLDISCINLNNNELPTKDIYCGTAVELCLTTKSVPEEEMFKFKKNAKEFYIRFLEYLRKKYDFNDFFLNWFPKFSPDHGLGGETNSIVPLIMKLFPCESEIVEKMNNEYRALSDIPELKKYNK